MPESTCAGDKPWFYPLDREHLKQMIRGGSSVDDLDQYGQSALTWAVRCDSLETAEFLISCGAQVDHLDGLDHTPLYYPARHGRQEMLTLLLNAGADPLFTLSDGRCPLTIAIDHDQADAAAAMLESAKADPRLSAILSSHLRSAIASDTTSSVSLMLKLGINDIIRSQDIIPFAACALFHHRSDLDLALKVAEAFPPRSDENEYQITFLHAAARLKSIELAQIGLQAGESIDIRRESDDATAVFLAVKYYAPKLLNWLLDHGADPDIPDADGTPPVSLAIQKKFNDLAILLMEAGAQVHPVKGRIHPLYMACEMRNTAMVRRLIDLGVSGDDGYDDSPCSMWIALHQRFREGTQLILDAGFHIEPTGGTKPIPHA
jgi:ankyrin repeat protein